MSKSLVIVESPTKARTIKKFLPAGYIVEASVGHVRDLPAKAEQIPAKYKKEAWSRLGVNVEKNFEALYVVPPTSKPQVKKLKALLAECDTLYLATDEDREGEAISWHLLELLKPKVPTKRLVFHEITKSAIKEALETPRELDESLVSAQETRRILDRLYGYSVSPVLWRNVGPKLSAGRVQSVTTRLIVDREKERMKFVRSGFWDLTGSFKGAEGPQFDAVLSSVDGKRIARGKDFDADTGVLTNKEVVHIDEALAEGLAKSLTDASFSVQTVEKKPFTAKPSPPFTTSTLQQESNRKLRLSARATMGAAQALYQNGLITYMRTDSTTLSAEAIQRSREEIESLYGAEYLPATPRQYQTKVANAQEAHEAIRPSSDFTKPEDIPKSLGDRERKVYELIWKRTMACQMENARGFRTSVAIVNAVDSSKEGVCVFKASGKTIEFPGYLRAYVEGADNPDAELADQETLLPSLNQGEDVDMTKVEPKGHTTQPPARYTEASLVKELEARGIGRPSTYASIIDTIQFRGYVEKNGTALIPTFIAFSVTNLMEEHFNRLVNYEFTAEMENDLDKISRGERKSLDYLRNFYFGDDKATEPTGGGLTGLLGAEIDARAVNTLPVGKDEDGQMINIRVGRYGPYLEVGEQEDKEERVRVTIPEGTAPDELTLERAKELIRKGSGPSDLGVDEETGNCVYAKTGRFGAYFQLGENDEEPKMKSLLPGMDLETATLEDALKMLRLPLTIGKDAEGEEILADYGRYGPYIKRGKDTRSLAEPEEIWTYDVEKALAKLAEPARRGRSTPKIIKEFGEDPSTGAEITLRDGRFGPYVTDGTTNASVPKGDDVEAVGLDRAVELIRIREAKGPVKRKKKAKKKAAKKKTAKKKTAKKKATKKKTTKKVSPEEPS